MPHSMKVAQAWMKCSEFAIQKASNNAPYPSLVERWTQKSIAYENQALLVLEMVEADVKAQVAPKAQAA